MPKCRAYSCFHPRHLDIHNPWTVPRPTVVPHPIANPPSAWRPRDGWSADERDRQKTWASREKRRRWQSPYPLLPCCRHHHYRGEAHRPCAPPGVPLHCGKPRRQSMAMPRQTCRAPLWKNQYSHSVRSTPKPAAVVGRFVPIDFFVRRAAGFSSHFRDVIFAYGPICLILLLMISLVPA